MPMCQLISNASFAIFHWTLISCLLYKMKMKKKGSGMGNLFDEKLSSMLLCWWAPGLHLGGIKLSSEHQYAAPWVVSLWLVMTKLFIGPKHNNYAFLWFYLVYFIQYHYLSVNFFMWIVKQKIENKRNMFMFYVDKTFFF